MEVSDQLHDALLFAQARTQNFSFLGGAGRGGGGIGCPWGYESYNSRPGLKTDLEIKSTISLN